MSVHQPHSYNRLLRLEQELFRLRQAVMGKAAALGASTPPPPSHNNRLLALEQDLLRSRRRAWGSPTPPISPAAPSVKPTHQPPQRWQVQARAFDFNEAIDLEYRGNPFMTVPDTNREGESNNYQTTVIPLMQSASTFDWHEVAFADIGPFQVEAFVGDLPLPLPSDIRPQPTVSAQPPLQSQNAPTPLPLPTPSTLSGGPAVQIGAPSPLTSAATILTTYEQPVLDSPPSAYPEPSSTPPPISPPTIPVSASATAEMMSVSQPASHSVFDHFAQSLTYATSFDLGTVALEQRLDEFDCLLDQGEH